MLTGMLTATIVVSAAAHIRAEYAGRRKQVYLFKPLTTMLIILMGGLVSRGGSSWYKTAILMGMLFSLGGDIFLMLPERFMAGLISFLIAHFFYISAFTGDGGFSISLPSALPFIVFAVLVYIYLAPGLNRMKLPVGVYVMVILLMAWQAFERWRGLGGTAPMLASAGALFFVISDAILAVNRFRREFASARALNLSTYFAAQYLIAMSLG